MSKPLKPRRGTTAEQNAFIGEAYEVTYDTDKNTLVCRDGVTPGGFPLLRADQQAAKDEEQDAKIAEALDKVGLPLGFEYVRLTGETAPIGGVDYMGQTATRAMYADLWAWLNENKPDAIVSESEWQSLYSSQNGNVAKYSTGDGSTTFRFPRVVGYFKGVGSVDELGQYTKEGLPDASHTHTRGSMNITGRVQDLIKVYWNGASATGAFGLYGSSGKYTTGSEGTTNHNGFDFDASRSWTGETSVASLSDSNPIFGNSTHVTPETVTVVMGVIAFGSVGSIGEATEEGIVAELGELGATKAETDLSNLSAAGRNQVVALGMPSARSVALTFGASGAKYTAPANGWFFLDIVFVESAGWCSIWNETLDIGQLQRVYREYVQLIFFFPARKGDSVRVQHNMTLNSTPNFRFVYAEGAE